MVKRGKKYEAAATMRDGRLYGVPEAAAKVKQMAQAGFNETVDIAVRLGVDPRHADQIVRGTVVLPYGTGKSVRVLVITQGEKLREAESAGADFVGGKDMIQKIQEGWLDFDVIVATPDMMSEVGKLGRLLGPRGLMPNPKSGTVTFDIARVVREVKAGKIEFRVDKTGNVHAPIGKVSFSESQLAENISAFLEAVLRAKPAAAKGVYMRNIALSSSMSPSVRLDPNPYR